MMSLKYSRAAIAAGCLLSAFLLSAAMTPVFAEEGGALSDTTKDMSDAVKNLMDIHDTVNGGGGSGGDSGGDSGAAADDSGTTSLADAVQGAMADNSPADGAPGEAGTPSPAMERHGFHPGMSRACGT